MVGKGREEEGMVDQDHRTKVVIEDLITRSHIKRERVKKVVTTGEIDHRLRGIDQKEIDHKEIDHKVIDHKEIDRKVIDRKVIDRKVIDRKVIDRKVIDRMEIERKGSSEGEVVEVEEAEVVVEGDKGDKEVAEVVMRRNMSQNRRRPLKEGVMFRVRDDQS